MKMAKVVPRLLFALAIAATCWVVFSRLPEFLVPKHLQTLQSPTGAYTAKLHRVVGFDRIYFVSVNGKRVYHSPDFSPRTDLDFKEELTWDASGHMLILSIAGHRIFGYDAKQSRRLTDEQLLAVELAPDPPLWEYEFESEWPGIGRAKRPDPRHNRRE